MSILYLPGSNFCLGVQCCPFYKCYLYGLSVSVCECVCVCVCVHACAHMCLCIHRIRVGGGNVTAAYLTGFVKKP